MADMVDDTLVLALGNPLRADDGIGMAVLEMLSMTTLPQSITLIDGGTAGLETAILLQGYRRVIIIDAAEMQLPSGTWRRFDHTTLQPTVATPLTGTLHDAGLNEALLLAEALNILPEEVVIYGIQPESLAWECGISSTVHDIIPDVSAAILKELNHSKGTNNV